MLSEKRYAVLFQTTRGGTVRAVKLGVRPPRTASQRLQILNHRHQFRIGQIIAKRVPAVAAARLRRVVPLPPFAGRQLRIGGLDLAVPPTELYGSTVRVTARAPCFAQVAKCRYKVIAWAAAVA